MKKVLKLIMVVFFPLGLVYCVVKNLFSGNFVSFIGGVLLFAIGFGLAVYLLRPDMVGNVFSFFGKVLD